MTFTLKKIRKRFNPIISIQLTTGKIDIKIIEIMPLFFFLYFLGGNGNLNIIFLRILQVCLEYNEQVLTNISTV